MPKIFNTSWLAVLMATLSFYLIGFAVYGFLFQDVWLAASGMTQAETEAMAEAQGAMVFVWGLLITIAQALGLLWVIDLAGAKWLPKCLSIAFWLFIMIGRHYWLMPAYMADIACKASWWIMATYLLDISLWQLFTRFFAEKTNSKSAKTKTQSKGWFRPPHPALYFFTKDAISDLQLSARAAKRRHANQQ